MKIDKKVLIVGGIPFSNSSQAKTFLTYFGSWNNDNTLFRQIYVKSYDPSSLFCESYFRLTDKKAVKSRLFFKKCSGKIFNKSNINLNTLSNYRPKNTNKKKTYFDRLIRRKIWKHNVWESKQLINWVDEFKPDLIFVCFGDDFYQFDISLKLSERYNIPIVTVISDDYLYAAEERQSLFAKIYAHKYRKALDKFFSNPNKTAVAFNSPSIQEKYLARFNININDVVYIGYDEKYNNLNNKVNKDIVYFGNFAFGRDKTIISIAKELENYDLKLKVFGPNPTKEFINKLNSFKNTSYEGYVDNIKMLEEIKSSSFLLYVESFNEKDLLDVKYALSTKIANYLVSGHTILAIGNKDAGSINYLVSNNCSEFALNENNIKMLLCKITSNSYSNKDIKESAINLANANHKLEINAEKFANLVNKLLEL